MKRFRSFFVMVCGLMAMQVIHSQPYTFSTRAGLAGVNGSVDGIGGNARFHYPTALAVDDAGNIYVADNYSNAIRKISPGGEVTTLAGSGEKGSADGNGTNAQFYWPSGVAVDAGGVLYVTDSWNNTIRKITPDREVSTLAGLAGTTGSADGVGSSARFNDPFGIAVDRSGIIYVGDAKNNTVRKVTPDGVVSTLAGLAGISGSADGVGSNARFYRPFGVAVDSVGNVYVVDTSNHTVRKITPDGVVSTLAGLAASYGSADGIGSNARFCRPYGIAVDNTGTIYVADSINFTIRKVTPSGVVSTLAGLVGISGSADGVGSNALFNSPEGIAVDRAGNLCVADTYNSTIRLGRLTPPLLSYSVSNGQLILSWPLVASNFMLESSSVMIPTPLWRSQTNGAVALGDRLFVTNSLQDLAKFYRLQAR